MVFLVISNALKSTRIWYYLWRWDSKAQLNYQFVFVSIIEDGEVAVVGKTSFWDTHLINGSTDSDSSEEYNLADLYRPYLTNENSTANAIITHYENKKVNRYLM